MPEPRQRRQGKDHWASYLAAESRVPLEFRLPAQGGTQPNETGETTRNEPERELTSEMARPLAIRDLRQRLAEAKTRTYLPRPACYSRKSPHAPRYPERHPRQLRSVECRCRSVQARRNRQVLLPR